MKKALRSAIAQECGDGVGAEHVTRPLKPPGPALRGGREPLRGLCDRRRQRVAAGRDLLPFREGPAESLFDPAGDD